MQTAYIFGKLKKKYESIYMSRKFFTTYVYKSLKYKNAKLVI